MRLLYVVVPLALLSFPTQAAGPLVLIAKQLVQAIIIDVIEAQVADMIRASFGPCKADLAEDAVDQSRKAFDLLRSRGGPPGLGAVGNLGSLGSAAGALGAAPNAAAGASSVLTGAASALGGSDAARAAGALSSASGAMGSATATRGMEALGALGGQFGAQLGSGGSAELERLMQSAGGMPNMAAAGGADMQQALAMMQQMQNAKPLSPAELEELVLMLERFGKVADAIEPGTGCSAGDYRRIFARASVATADPRLGGQPAAMISGVFRTLHTSLKDIDVKSAEAAQTFSKMGPEDQADFVASTVADLRARPPEQRRAFIAMLDAGMLGIPENMARTLRAQIA